VRRVALIELLGSASGSGGIGWPGGSAGGTAAVGGVREYLAASAAAEGIWFRLSPGGAGVWELVQLPDA
jgi:hypothetical protein